MKRLFTSLVLTVCFYCTVFPQTKQEAQSQKMLDSAAGNGKEMVTQITVRNNVSAQAVLIPQTDARRIFGKEIAEHYAVIEVNIGNKSPDSALIVHGVFIDYSRWALSGFNQQGQSLTVGGAPAKPFEAFQSSTSSNQVASEEYRVVRGQLQNARLFSGRSWTMRALELAADIATAYPFGLSARELKYFGVFSGNLVPGIEKLWPEDTEAQLLRISDYGYRTNKVIPKESAEIVVCFFPIGRFLTPGFAKLFLKKPALFFAPLQMLADKRLEKDVRILLNSLDSELDRDELAKAMPCYVRIVRETDFADQPDSLREQVNKSATNVCLAKFGLTRDPKNNNKINLIGTPNSLAYKASADKFALFLALDFISHMSLNSVTVTVDGAMTIDTSSMAPKVESVKFDAVDHCGGDQTPCFWSDLAADTGIRTGTIVGSYLTGGTIELEEKDLGFDVATVHEGSSDQMLNFSFKLTRPIPTGTKIHFKVTKPVYGVAALNAKTLDSKELEYIVNGPVISDVTYNASAQTITITGANPPASMIVKVRPPEGKGGGDVVLQKDAPNSTATTFVYAIPPTLTPGGCWTLLAFVDTTQPVGTPAGKITFPGGVTLDDAATFSGSKITLKGKGLDSTDCGTVPLAFTVLDQTGNSVKFDKDSGATATQASLSVSEGTPTNKWTVKVTFDGKPLKVITLKPKVD
jgi:hypothetical protein